ncbi:C2 family cysteine protease [Thermoactinospora rubra]|uniref:C2 family cysteine protease n=1 Tax=Thermoactinospora rubra TaxID=1088767 RepID=UPI000A106600|nr:C2 family cysteine protease [Thermoactinospora rubra]
MSPDPAYRGFDIPRLRVFARDLKNVGAGAPALHRDLGKLLAKAETALEKPATQSPALLGVFLPSMPLFGPTAMPASLERKLGEMGESINRRSDHLEKIIPLQLAGFPVSDKVIFSDERPPDPKKVQEALDRLAALKNLDGGMNGNRDDLREIKALLEGLTQAELDAFMRKVPAEDLKRYGEAIHNRKDSWLTPFDENGLPHEEWSDHVNALLSKVQPEHFAKFVAAFPGAQPPFDVAKDDQNRTQSPGSITWGVPNLPLFKDGVDVSDVSQGAVGDCWFIANLGAVAQRDPEFIRSGIRRNPNGTISVRLFDKEGREHWVTVTPDLPLDANGNPRGATGDGELWPAYYEKAFAQFYNDDNDDKQGSYGAIVGDYPEKGAKFLTGKGSDVDDPDFDDLKEAWENGHSIIVSTPGKQKVPDHLKNSFVTGHAYFVEKVEGDKVVLRNPWGHSTERLVVTKDEFEDLFQDQTVVDR